MNQVSSNSFVKGLEGEKYVAEEISKLGYETLYVGGCQLYSIVGNRFFVVDLEGFGKGKSFWIQVKYKEPRRYYPDTGMERWRYERLIKHQEESGLPVLILFTDKSRKIYGEWVNRIGVCESSYGGNQNMQTGDMMVYWEVDKLRDYKELLGVVEKG